MRLVHGSCLSLLLVASVGCKGEVLSPWEASSSSAPDDSEVQKLCSEGTPYVSPHSMQRLDPSEYVNTLRDLFQDPALEVTVNDDQAVLSERGVRQLRSAAETVMSRRSAWGRPIFPCDPSQADDACAMQLIGALGTRTYRHPPSTEEKQRLLTVFQTASAVPELGPEGGLEAVVQVMLQSPQMVYLHNEGTPSSLPYNIQPLTDYELAARLSYFLWDTTPDDALLDAAAAGSLSDPAGLRAQAERLLADPRAEKVVQRFFWDWLQLSGGRLHHSLEEVMKDSSLFPEFGPALTAAMRTETQALVKKTFFEASGSFDDLLTGRSAYVNGPLANLYGLSNGPTTQDDWQWVTLDETQRSGLLTRAAFLSVFAAERVPSPIRRGVFVIEQMLCNELGEPPPNASDVPVEGGDVAGGDGTIETLSVRQDVIAKTSGSDCVGCHGIINPIGFTFQRYDAIGRWQDTELVTNLPIDSTGQLSGSDVDQELADAVELSRVLASSERVKSCFADRWMEEALGHAPSAQDACAADKIRQRFMQTGDMRELLLSIIESDLFRYVNGSKEVQP